MIRNISAFELKERLDNGEDIVVIDVRNDWELLISKVDFAQHIVLHEIPAHVDEIPEDKPVVFMCRSGGRSMQAAMFMVHNGRDPEKMMNLADGILGWARDIDPRLPKDY